MACSDGMLFSAGKSTSLSIIANLLGRSSGFITFEGGVTRPPRGTLGIVPQKNVLFPDLTCYQTLRVWRAVKYSSQSVDDGDDYEQLLRDCDLGKKIHSNANALSGGQKRKLQLAIGLIGGSKIVLVDECTSGVDPLSRRALWRILTSVKHDRTIVFTTHFLDEADLLADKIAILAAPGKLVAEGSPVALKTNLGQGYSVQVTFDLTGLSEKDIPNPPMEVLDRIRELAPQCTLSQASPTHAAYHLKSKDSVVVENVLKLLDDEGSQNHIASYDVLGTSIEDIFLDLMDRESRPGSRTPDSGEKSMNSSDGAPGPTIPDLAPPASIPPVLTLTDGCARSPFSQALTIFYKRALIARRSWLTPTLAVVIAVCGSCVPLFYLSGQPPSCTLTFQNETVIPLYWPDSPIGTVSPGPSSSVLTSPPDITSTLGQTTVSLQIENIPDNATFVSTIQQDYLNISFGGISIDTQTGNSLVAWEASPPGLTGPAMMNLATNILYNRALNASGDTAGTPSIIMANYASFPPIAAGTLVDLKWIAFFGAAMVRLPMTMMLTPAYSYPLISPYFLHFSRCMSQESEDHLSKPCNSQMACRIRSASGWATCFGTPYSPSRSLPSLSSSSLLCLISSTALGCLYVAFSPCLFNNLPSFDQWVVLVLYGIVGALFAYCISLFMSSPLTSFAAVAGYQIIMYIVSAETRRMERGTHLIYRSTWLVIS
jgi:ATP-binding cassette subfamily A (ABC1) protein 3